MKCTVLLKSKYFSIWRLGCASLSCWFLLPPGRCETVEAGAEAQRGLHAAEAGLPHRRGTPAGVSEGDRGGGFPSGTHSDPQPLHPN